MDYFPLQFYLINSLSYCLIAVNLTSPYPMLSVVRGSMISRKHQIDPQSKNYGIKLSSKHQEVNLNKKNDRKIINRMQLTFLVNI